MKKLVVWLCVLAALLGVKAWAQDAPETWQGMLHAGQDVRLALQITKADGTLKGKLFNVDQSVAGMNTTTISLDGGVLKFTLLGIDVNYKNVTARRAALRASLPDWAFSQGFNIEARADNRKRVVCTAALSRAL